MAHRLRERERGPGCCLPDRDRTSQAESADDRAHVDDADLAVPIEIGGGIKAGVPQRLPVRRHKTIQIGLINAVVAVQVALAELVRGERQVLDRVRSQRHGAPLVRHGTSRAHDDIVVAVEAWHEHVDDPGLVGSDIRLEDGGS